MRWRQSHFGETRIDNLSSVTKNENEGASHPPVRLDSLRFEGVRDIIVGGGGYR